MKDYKAILQDYISSIDAANGSIVYQPINGLVEVCKTEETKKQLLELVNNSEISNYKGVCSSAYCELIGWAQETDMLLESSKGVLFCLPKTAEK